MSENIIEMANELARIYERAWEYWNGVVSYIIENQIQDNNYIERVLDYILDIYTDKGFDLFLKLCSYYATFNKQGALDYLKILKEYREDEYDEEKVKKLLHS